jgi:hypothetical protein
MIFVGGGSIMCVFNLCTCSHESNIFSQLSRGLTYLFQLANAGSYEKRHKLLGIPKFRKTFLYDVFTDFLGRRDPTVDYTLLSDYDDEKMKKLVHSAAIIDPDPGPAEVWRLTHLDKSCDQFVMAFYPGHRSLRERGYVMWDHERLANWGLLKIPWQAQPEAHAEWERARKRMQWSQNRRSKIWRRGGRGWWSANDESKVIYKQSTSTK